MSLSGVKALTFDTGGTLLDWHTGFREAFAEAGRRHGIDRDWAQLANELRRRSLAAMLNQGQDKPPSHNIDDAHGFCLDALVADEKLDAFDGADRQAIAWDAPHSFPAWPDVRDGLRALRETHIMVSFTILSYRLIIDTARRNGLTWDVVLSCEGLGVYKLLPEAYRRAAARLQLTPDQCLMVASHPYDLDAARSVGFRTALIRRPDEWGPETREHSAHGQSDPYDLELNDLIELGRIVATA
jgi:2-haloacid dehalogenase